MITFDSLISVSLVVVSRTCTFAFRSQTIFSFCFASQPESSSRSHLHNEQTIVAKTDLTFITIFLPSERQRGLKGRESSHDQKELRCCVVDGDFLLPITRPRWMQPLSVHCFFRRTRYLIVRPIWKCNSGLAVFHHQVSLFRASLFSPFPVALFTSDDEYRGALDLLNGSGTQFRSWNHPPRGEKNSSFPYDN